MPWLIMLIATFAVAAGWLARDLVDVFSKTGRNARTPIDFTAAAARGDLLFFDWSDRRPDDNQRAAG